MLFNNLKKTKVSYTENKQTIPSSLFTHPQPVQTNEVMCPAVQSVSNRLFSCQSFITIEITFSIKNNDVYYEYDFSAKEFQSTPEMHNVIKELFETELVNGKAVLQFTSNLSFITDTKDVEVVCVPSPNVNTTNCSFVSGGFYITNWIRPVNDAFIQIDNTKEAKVKLKFGEPMLYVLFNKPVVLNHLIDIPDHTKKYSYSMFNITRYLKNINKHYSRIKKNRPNKLLK